MEGYFEMVAADGELFKAKIPIFTLLNPGALH
jgi:ApaG protein